MDRLGLGEAGAQLKIERLATEMIEAVGCARDQPVDFRQDCGVGGVGAAQRKGTARLNAGIGGIERLGARERRHRPVVPAGTGERSAEQPMRLGIAGIKLRRALDRRDGRRVRPHCEERVAEIEPGGVHARVDGDGALESRHSLRHAAAVLANDPQQVQRRGIFGAALGDLAHRRLRRGEIARLHQRQSLL